jgi:hypothetical protein
MPNGYLNAFRGPDEASIDRAAYSNRLMRNDVDRIPQRNAAEDMAIAADQQTMGQNRSENARKMAADMFTAIADAQDPISTGAMLVQSQAFREIGGELKLPVDQFRPAQGDDPEQIRAAARSWAQAVGAQQNSNLPVGVAEHEYLTRGMSPQDEMQARRIQLGLEPRAVDMRERNPPSGYQWQPDGTLTHTPGGPADPTGPNLRRNSTALRKEYEDQKAVADYRLVLPVYQRAATAEDTRAGDISIIYALGKIFDPGSVVREGELQLSMQAAPWLQQIVSNAKSQITGEGRLSPALRAELVRAMNGQVEALRAPYVQERERYSGYATDFGFTSDSVVGPDPAAAFGPQGKPDFTNMSDEELLRLANGG